MGDYICRSAIVGELKSGDRVRVREDFVSDDEARAELNKGMSGKVLRTDGDGGAFIKFQRDDLDDDDVVSHWVFKTSFWDKFEKCRGDSECSDMLQAYQTCKQETSTKGLCKA